jgi:hypothetical protein
MDTEKWLCRQRTAGVLEYWINDKSQNSSIKLQVNLKIQYSMTKTSEA